MSREDRRAALPAVNRLLDEARAVGLDNSHGHNVLVGAIRDVLDRARSHGGSEPEGGWMAAIQSELERTSRPSLVRVINATGVVLHTNLGRAPLAQRALDAMQEAAGYCTLEYDIDAGERGSRHDHVRALCREVTGAEDAVAVNNAASALVLVLNALAAGGETIVSRGELVEIGGAFRIPEILAKSGSVLVEVGTTNRTRLRDYEAALSPRTRGALKVHRSNFQVRGFESEVSIAELASLFTPRALPIIHDVGSGLLVDLDAWGLRGEPLVADSVAAGAVVVCSADKLLGGPQAGLILGPAGRLDRIRRNPFARAFRPDKMVLAGLTETMRLYRDPTVARREIPVLRMLTMEPAELRRRAERIVQLVAGARTEEGQSAVGGGAFPEAYLPTTLVAIPSPHPGAVLERLRLGTPPIVARTADGAILIDPRTLQDEDLEMLAERLIAARQ